MEEERLFAKYFLIKKAFFQQFITRYLAEMGESKCQIRLLEVARSRAAVA